MPKFHVHATVIGGKYLGVFEAEDADAAELMALKTAHVKFCWQCDSECENPMIEDVTAEEVDPDEEEGG
jgi:hypothetical protein